MGWKCRERNGYVWRWRALWCRATRAASARGERTPGRAPTEAALRSLWHRRALRQPICAWSARTRTAVRRRTARAATARRDRHRQCLRDLVRDGQLSWIYPRRQLVSRHACHLRVRTRLRACGCRSPSRRRSRMVDSQQKDQRILIDPAIARPFLIERFSDYLALEQGSSPRTSDAYRRDVERLALYSV